MIYDLCILGGGQSGLVTLKTFSEKTNNIVLLEKCNGCVGLFANIKENQMFKWSTSSNMSGFSDFPIPKDVQVWFTIKDYVKYLDSYNHHFDLEQYIHYNSNVNKSWQIVGLLTDFFGKLKQNIYRMGSAHFQKYANSLIY